MIKMSITEKELNHAREQLENIYKLYPEAIHCNHNMLFFGYVLPLVYGVEDYWSFKHLCIFLNVNKINSETYRRMAQKIREERRIRGEFVDDVYVTDRLEEEWREYLKKNK